ncbi:septum site-determining protein Ssd [Arthrobacter sp. BL-252-APC-1A]|uniref:septum site-determining protein Ssd n=1 Tax=Arthrobacter sp. BL-252-APC-1A TaxID=2606622 RepID=UPI0018A6D218|nr:septum site-determining protein Ssd [Arthrobacter sp. BL-252-APC-1A]
MTDTLFWRPGPQPREAQVTSAALPPDESVVLVRPAEQQLQDEVARISVAAGVDLVLAETLAEAEQSRPGIVLVDRLGLRGTGGAGLFTRRGPETVCVGYASDQPWTQAAQAGADRVVVLPEGSAWLAEYLARSHGPAGRVIGVAGTFGGSGGSTLACLLAQEAASAGHTVLLADGDPAGAGLEHRLGAEYTSGLRWRDLADVRGTVNPQQLASALPGIGSFSLLAHPAGEAPPGRLGLEVLPTVLQAARGSYGLTILDLGTSPAPGSPALEQCDAVLAVAAGQPGRLLSARSWYASLGDRIPPVWAVVRGPMAEGLDEVRVAALLDLPLAGYLPWARSLNSAQDDGQLLRVRRRRLRRALAGILAALDPLTAP